MRKERQKAKRRRWEARETEERYWRWPLNLYCNLLSHILINQPTVRNLMWIYQCWLMLVIQNIHRRHFWLLDIEIDVFQYFSGNYQKSSCRSMQHRTADCNRWECVQQYRNDILSELALITLKSNKYKDSYRNYRSWTQKVCSIIKQQEPKSREVCCVALQKEQYQISTPQHQISGGKYRSLSLYILNIIN